VTTQEYVECYKPSFWRFVVAMLGAIGSFVFAYYGLWAFFGLGLLAANLGCVGFYLENHNRLMEARIRHLESLIKESGSPSQSE